MSTENNNAVSVMVDILTGKNEPPPAPRRQDTRDNWALVAGLILLAIFVLPIVWTGNAYKSGRTRWGSDPALRKWWYCNFIALAVVAAIVVLALTVGPK